MDKIFDANDRAKELGFMNNRAMFAAFAKINRKQWTGKIGTASVLAYVAEGRWLADCPACREAAYVTPFDPIHFCAQCGNAYSNGDAARVIFPKNSAEIEAALLERAAKEAHYLQRTATVPIGDAQARNWQPGETVTDLRKQAKGRK